MTPLLNAYLLYEVRQLVECRRIDIASSDHGIDIPWLYFARLFAQKVNYLVFVRSLERETDLQIAAELRKTARKFT